jgi:2-dehydro-3-deoxyphosphogalactonate aldolase
MTFDEGLAACPLIAILRGVEPSAALAHCEALFEAGLRVVEIPQNSPGPLESVSRAAGAMAGRMSVGAGTVLTVGWVRAAAGAGAGFIVSPDTNPAVIRTIVASGLAAVPGFATATEAFAALEAGARHLKLFPASTYGPAHLKVLKAVLPAEIPVFAVGGVGPDDMAAWLDVGTFGFGLGSELFRPGQRPDETLRRARAAVSALRR